MIYLLPLILLLLTLSGQSHAYTTQTPEISGYNGRTMKLTGGSGGYSGGSYSRTGNVVINGKTVPIPGSLKASSTMGNIVKNALKLNPYRIAGTLALAWLLEQGIEWSGSEWKKESTVTADSTGLGNCTRDPDGVTLQQCTNQIVTYWGVAYEYVSTTQTTATNWRIAVKRKSDGNLVENAGNWGGTITCPAGYTQSGHQCVSVELKPMTDAEWDALADPMPAVGDELPTAPYLPDGVTIVEPPAYIPETKTIGAPYTKADGSTAQPMAKITPVGDGQVAIDTYEQPLTNPDGTPVPAGTTPVDTTEQAAPPKDPCTDNPKRLGCMDAGEDEKEIPTKSIDFSFTPEANPLSMGSCPAPISVLGHTISYQPACDAMGMINALIIAMSSLTAAYILIGAFKSE